jgi:hypothetical protein
MKSIQSLLHIYPTRDVTPRYAVAFVGLIVFASVILFVALGPKTGPTFATAPVIDQMLAVLSPGIWVLILVGTFLRYRPVSMDGEGVCNYVLGWRWKYISWSDVVRIQKLRSWDSFRSQNVVSYVVYGPKTRIRFQDTISGLSELLRLANSRIGSCNISVEFTDYGRDTLAKALSEISDPIERRKALWRGMNSQISSL